MASDTPGDPSVSVNLPESLRRWLDDKASEEGRTREDVLLQLLSAYRKVDGLEEGDVDPPGEVGVDGVDQLPVGLRRDIEARIDERVEQRVDERVEKRVEERVEAPADAVGSDEFDERLTTFQSRFVDLLEDVRERVVQVKRETDAKAPAEHDHPGIEASLTEFREAAAEVEALAGDLETLEARVASGFDNYEEVLEYLTESIDSVSARQTTLARALVETRDELRKLAARDSARSAAEALKRTANQHGIRTADCGDCESPVDVGLLTRSQCPHCSATFVDVVPSRGFFGTDTLETGDRPALEAGEAAGDGFEYGVDDIIEGDDAERPAVGVDSGPSGGSERDRRPSSEDDG